MPMPLTDASYITVNPKGKTYSDKDKYTAAQTVFDSLTYDAKRALLLPTAQKVLTAPVTPPVTPPVVEPPKPPVTPPVDGNGVPTGFTAVYGPDQLAKALQAATGGEKLWCMPGDGYAINLSGKVYSSEVIVAGPRTAIFGNWNNLSSVKNLTMRGFTARHHAGIRPKDTDLLFAPKNCDTIWWDDIAFEGYNLSGVAIWPKKTSNRNFKVTRCLHTNLYFAQIFDGIYGLLSENNIFDTIGSDGQKASGGADHVYRGSVYRNFQPSGSSKGTGDHPDAVQAQNAVQGILIENETVEAGCKCQGWNCFGKNAAAPTFGGSTGVMVRKNVYRGSYVWAAAWWDCQGRIEDNQLFSNTPGITPAIKVANSDGSPLRMTLGTNYLNGKPL